MSRSLMVKLARKKEEEKMLELIPKMRKGECRVAEIWRLRYCVYMNRGMSDAVRGLLDEVPGDKKTPHGAWLRALVVLDEYGEGQAIEVLKPHDQDPLCASLLGELLADSDTETACRYIQESANAGCAEGIYQLGHVYRGGWKEILPNQVRSFDLFCIAARMMHPGALHQVGECLRCSIVVTRDTSRHMTQCYTLASRLGNSNSILQLGYCHHDGQGVKMDLRCAVFLYRRAFLFDGNPLAGHALMDTMKQHPEACIPYGEWQPDSFLHQFVPNNIHHQIRTVLLMHARRGSLFSRLPRVLLPKICFWICTEYAGYQIIKDRSWVGSVRAFFSALFN